jgi:hypothetical protein
MIKAATEQNFVRVLYSFFKKVYAPLRINLETSAILAFDEGCFSTHLYNQKAAANARREITIEAIWKNSKLKTFILL